MYSKGLSGEMPIAHNVSVVYYWKVSNSKLDGVFLVANAQLEDFPIVYVSDKFTGKMGYTRADLIGQPITLDFMGNKAGVTRIRTDRLPQTYGRIA